MKIFVFDFDGTITKEDTTDLILGIPDEKQISQIEEDWKRGKIASYECMKAQTRFLSGISIERIHQHLREHSHLDAAFPALMRFLKAAGFHTVVLSEGYDVSIRFHQVHEYVDDVYCSKLLIEDGKATGKLKVLNEKRWDYNEQCVGCCTCKVDLLQQLNKKFNITKTFAVGDGLSDGCLFQHVDVSFSLDTDCKATYQVEDLGDVLKALRETLKPESKSAELKKSGFLEEKTEDYKIRRCCEKFIISS